MLAHLLRLKFSNGGEPDTIREIIHSIARQARKGHFGCTLVIDPQFEPSEYSGEIFQQPLDLREPLNLQITGRLARVDGALCLDSRGSLRAAGCLLDGSMGNHENRARGARYNSACRYTSKRSEVVVITISEDGPFSTFADGKLYSPYPKVCRPSARVEELDTWLAR